MAPMAEQATGEWQHCCGLRTVQQVTSQEPAKSGLSSEELTVALPKGSGIFTQQLWKTVGLVPKQLGRAHVQCAANCVGPKTLARASTAGSLARLMSGGSSLAGDGGSCRSSSGCDPGAVSANMAPEVINPKTLKMAAIMAWEASQTEHSDASGVVSDSTGVSPGWLAGEHSGGGGGGFDRGLDRGGGGGGFDRGLDRGGGGSGFYRQSSLAPSSGGWGGDGYSSAYGSGGAWGGEFSRHASCKSDTAGSSDTAAALAVADPAQLLECLFCGVRTCVPNAASTVGCSDCAAVMHKECFIAHYRVVPSRRDWTYCPTHAVAPKNQVPAKPHEKPPSARAVSKARRATAAAAAASARSGGASAKRPRDPSAAGERAQRPRRERRDGDGFRRRRLESPHASDRGASPSSADGGGSGGSGRLAAPISRPQRARPVNYAAMEGADADGDVDDATAADPAAAANKEMPQYQQFEASAPAAPPPLFSPSSPDSNASESGSAAEPGSPPVAAAAKAAGSPPSADAAADATPAQQSALSVAVQQPSSSRERHAPIAVTPASPSSSAKSGSGLRSPRSPPTRRVAPPPAAFPRRNTPRALAAADKAPATATPKSPPPALAKTAAELADEELAMLLHQEFNGSSRRRGPRAAN